MRDLSWKKITRDTHYGVWYELEFGLKHYSGILLREPICLRQIHLDNINPNPSESHLKYLNELYHDENPCPKKGECGWLIDVSDFGWNEPLDEMFELRRGVKNPPAIQINSFTEARELMEKRIFAHIEKFKERLLGAKGY